MLDTGEKYQTKSHPNNFVNIIFFGSSKYSTIVEESLIKNFGLSAVVTVADKIIGREKELKPTPVKLLAKKNNIQIIAADKLTDGIIENITDYKPDFLVVADYGVLLPKKLLELPKNSALNIHHSLLPKYRGPSPAPTFILSGEKTTGVTVMEMAEGLDTGDILAQKEYDITPTDTTDSLLTKLNTLGAELLTDVLKGFEEFHQNRKKQDESKATYTQQMVKKDGFFDIKNLPEPKKLDHMIRAYFPWPGVYTKMDINGMEKTVKFLPSSSHPELAPLRSSKYSRGDSGSSRILLQPEGKKPMTKKDFLNGYPNLKEQLEKLLGN